ncbi:MAG: hypothetical protein KDN19_08115 [Verrucomicrobiae bacterium]|nr:hypothetical protein [Verrucomicrobiae bacterium]
MSTTLRALQGTLEEDGTIRLSEPCDLRGPLPVVVTVAVEDEEPLAEREWMDEIEKRASEVDAGEVEMIDEASFFDRLRTA